MKYETAMREEDNHGSGISGRSILEWANKGGWELVAVFAPRSQGVGHRFYFKRPVTNQIDEVREELAREKEAKEWYMQKWEAVRAAQSNPPPEAPSDG